MTNIKQRLEKELPLIVEKSYQQACYYFKIIPTKRAVFKGFFSSEIYQVVLNNQEILANLGVDSWQRKAFEKALRSEEHTSELQSRSDLVCRLLLEKKKNMEQ